MVIIIEGTSTFKYLNLIDLNTSIDYVEDFIGNTGAFTDGQFKFDSELNAYVCSKETWEWWIQVVEDTRLLNERIYFMSEFYGSDAINDVVNSVSLVDLEDYASTVNSAIDEYVRFQKKA